MEENLKEMIAEQLNASKDQVVPQATFDGLGADSIDMVELSMTVEEALDVSIPDAELKQFATVADMTAYIKENKK